VARADGFTTVQYVLAVGMSLVVFVMMANLLVDRYERGAIVAAVDEGARAGATIDAGAAECEERARQVVDALLGPRDAHRTVLRCRLVGGSMRATVQARLASWFPLVPDWDVAVTGSAPKERAP
jgi:hypothetical protein